MKPHWIPAFRRGISAQILVRIFLVATLSHARRGLSVTPPKIGSVRSWIPSRWKDRLAAFLAVLLLAGASTLVSALPSAAAAAPGITVLLAHPATPPVVCPGVDTQGTMYDAQFPVATSYDARYILLSDACGSLIRRDNLTGSDLDVTTEGSLHLPHSAANLPKDVVQISGDGQTVIYGSSVNNITQIVSHNIATKNLSIASSAVDGTSGNAPSSGSSLSSNGQWLLFASIATNLVAGIVSPGNYSVLYRKNLTTGTVDAAAPTSAAPTGYTLPGGISDDGNIVTFTSTATNLVGAPPEFVIYGSYLRDLTTGVVQRLYYSPAGISSQGSGDPRVSADGKRAVFIAKDNLGFATDIVSCTVPDQLGAGLPCTAIVTELRDPFNWADTISGLHIAANGSAIEYGAKESVQATWQVFRTDLASGVSAVASVNNAGEIANYDAGEGGISGDGSTEFFGSFATNLDPAATDFHEHAYLRVGTKTSPPPPATTLNLTLAPSIDVGTINGTRTLTAVLTRNGVPLTGGLINFAVTSGPCTGKTATSTTDDTGGGAWGYACNVEGTDTVTATASVPNGAGGVVSAIATATITWVAPDTYVALGDSYSSGEGAPGLHGYVDSTNSSTNKCHRSDQAYSYLDANVQGMPPIAQFHACSGALVEDFFTPFPENHFDDKGVPQNPTETHAQLDWIGPSTKVITLTVGGNNARFPEVMNYCAQRLNSSSCENFYKASVESSITNLSKSSNGVLHDNLPDLYAAIRAKAPNARVYVLGYPQFFPANPTRSCLAGAGKFFSVSDMKWINSEAINLDDHIKAAVQAAGQGFVYVPIVDAFRGHELCTKSPFLNSVMPLDRQESFHPNIEGQAKFADILKLYLRGLHL